MKTVFKIIWVICIVLCAHSLLFTHLANIQTNKSMYNKELARDCYIKSCAYINLSRAYYSIDNDKSEYYKSRSDSLMRENRRYYNVSYESIASAEKYLKIASLGILN